MNIGFTNSSFANTVSPFSTLGQEAVGEENTENKNSTLKSIEKSPESARGQNGTGQHAFADDPDTVKTKGEESDKQNRPRSVETNEEPNKRREEKHQQVKEHEQIRELASRDREVRAHEQAHASVGGQYAGSPQYQLERGPDGVSYAVSGEVSISTSKVANSPEASIAKAQQVRRAALAPADPSPQDRRVAASASQMEIEARKDLVEIHQQDARLEREQRQEEKAGRDKEESVRVQSAEESQQRQAARDASFKEQSDLQRSFQQRLVDIGISSNSSEVGQILSESA